MSSEQVEGVECGQGLGDHTIATSTAASEPVPLDGGTGSAYDHLFNIKINSPDRLLVQIGGMSDQEFDALPQADRELILAIDYERYIVALSLISRCQQLDVVRQSHSRMLEYAEGDQGPDPTDVYVQQVLADGLKLKKILPKRPPVLLIGNMPGALDRHPVQFMSDLSGRLMGMIERFLPEWIKADRDEAVHVMTGMHELFQNHLQHGNGSNPKLNLLADIHVNDRIFSAVVANEGWGYLPEIVGDPTIFENIGKINGRGRLLMRSFFDTVRTRPDGRRDVVIKRRKN
jgi:anti-sigma regulatory factor (Ser/Thr protein kinase)